MDDNDLNLFAGVEIDLEMAERTAAALRIEALKPAASAFVANLVGVRGLLAVPQLLAEIPLGALRVVESTSRKFVARLIGRIMELRDLEVPARDWKSLLKQVSAELSVSDQETSDEEPVRSLAAIGTARERREFAHHLFTLLDEHPEMKAGYRTLLTSATAGAWTAVECLATDVWVASLNARPMSLAMRAVAAEASGELIDGLSGKQISVGLLAKHGFDLRACMGTVLKPKFDLTSLSKIKKAYVAAFEKDKALDEALDGYDLDLLEASRHLIVHRGGLVDEEFQKRVRNVGVAHPVGALLPLDGPMVGRLANAAIAAGCRLLVFVDEWLVKNPS